MEDSREDSQDTTRGEVDPLAGEACCRRCHRPSTSHKRSASHSEILPCESIHVLRRAHATDCRSLFDLVTSPNRNTRSLRQAEQAAVDPILMCCVDRGKVVADILTKQFLGQSVLESLSDFAKHLSYIAQQRTRSDLTAQQSLPQKCAR